MWGIRWEETGEKKRRKGNLTDALKTELGTMVHRGSKNRVFGLDF
jgi:hypothetical protein